MNDPRLADPCSRCHEPVGTGDPRFVVRIDADPPLSSPVELWICSSCMDSLRRWVQKYGRQATGEPTYLRDAEPDARTRLRKRSGSRRSIYAEELDRNNRWVHRSLFLTVLAVVGIVAVLTTYATLVVRLGH